MAKEENQRMLQHFLYKPLLSASEFATTYEEIYSKRASTTELDSLVDRLNDQLELSQLAIKSRLCEDTSQKYYALISLTETEAAKYRRQTTSEFHPTEIEFFKHLLKEILASDNGFISSIDCINYTPNNPGKFSKTDAQRTLDKLIAAYWLSETSEGMVSFTVRTLLELEPLLKKLDEDLAGCKICHVLAVKGKMCPSDGCAAKIHHYCYSKMTKAMSSFKCPDCKTPWPKERVMDESASIHSTPSSQSETLSQSSQRSISRSSQRRSQKRPARIDHDDSD